MCQNRENHPKSAKAESAVFQQLTEFKEVVKLKGSGLVSRATPDGGQQDLFHLGQTEAK